MLANIALNHDDQRIAGHAINWQLNVPYEQTPPPRLSAAEADMLSALLTHLISLNRAFLSGTESVPLELGEPFGPINEHLRLPRRYFELLTDAVQSFHEELRSTPAELEIVTGLPLHRTSDLLHRLQVFLAANPKRTPGVQLDAG